MKRYLFLPLSFTLLAACHNQSAGTNSTRTDSTTVDPPIIKREMRASPYTGPRFEILQSTIAAKGTYRLDRHTGEVSQMQARGNKTEVWHQLRRIPSLVQGEDSTIAGRPNYHLFLSTIAMRFTYLINTNTGATWELVEDTQTGEDYFSPIFDR